MGPSKSFCDDATNGHSWLYAITATTATLFQPVSRNSCVRLLRLNLTRTSRHHVHEHYFLPTATAATTTYNLSAIRSVFTARCTIVQSAVLRSHVVCPSVCLLVRTLRWALSDPYYQSGCLSVCLSVCLFVCHSVRCPRPFTHFRLTDLDETW